MLISRSWLVAVQKSDYDNLKCWRQNQEGVPDVLYFRRSCSLVEKKKIEFSDTKMNSDCTWLYNAISPSNFFAFNP